MLGNLFKKKISPEKLVAFFVSDSYSTSKKVEKYIEDIAKKQSPLWSIEAVAIENFFNYFSVSLYYSEREAKSILPTYESMLHESVDYASSVEADNKFMRLIYTRFNGYKNILVNAGLTGEEFWEAVYKYFLQVVGIDWREENYEFFKKYAWMKIKGNHRLFKKYKMKC